MGKLKKKGTTLVEIKSLNKKGNGLAEVDEGEGVVSSVEVPFALPGEIATVCIRGKRKGQYSGMLENVDVPSKLRIAPRCKHFGDCGGCRLQNIPYDQQLEFKEAYIRKCFSAILDDTVDFRPAIGCDPHWQYRNKMEFSFSSDAAGNQFLGLVQASSKGKVLNLTECHLVNPWFSDVLCDIREWWAESGLNAYRLKSDEGALRTLVMREGKSTGDRMVMLTVSGNPDFALSKDQLENFVTKVLSASNKSAPGVKLSVYLRIQQVAKGMPTNFYEMLLHGPDHIREVLEVQISEDQAPLKLHFHVSPTAFFQPNTIQAEKLYSVALQMAGVAEGAVVYDLYCGTGTLGICAASCAKEVIGIEVSPESALDARTNASLNGLNNIKIICGAVRHVLAGLTGETLPKADLVVIDPPRPGLDPEAMNGLVELDPPRILYVSCNPETQAQNVEELMTHGYRIESIQPIDQFAHTPHIENIVVLQKESVNGNT